MGETTKACPREGSSDGNRPEGVTSPSPAQAVAPTTSGSELAHALEPHLRRATQGRLGEVQWFRSAWQRSDASTGMSTYKLPAGTVIDVLVKLPVAPREFRWSERLGRVHAETWKLGELDECPVPHVIEGDVALNGYDLCWMVQERLCGEAAQGPMQKETVSGIIDAAARFQEAAMRSKPVDEQPEARDWEGLFERSRVALDTVRIPQPQHWNTVLKKAQKSVGAVAAAWEARPKSCWCHGDLHPGNVMRRGESGPWVLLDLAMTHAGHWVEDAVYLERQFWHRKDDLCGVKPVSAMARARKALDLPMEGEHAELANLRRVLMAGCVPAMAHREGSASYCDAALELLERLLPLVPHG